MPLCFEDLILTKKFTAKIPFLSVVLSSSTSYAAAALCAIFSHFQLKRSQSCKATSHGFSLSGRSFHVRHGTTNLGEGTGKRNEMKFKFSGLLC